MVQLPCAPRVQPASKGQLKKVTRVGTYLRVLTGVSGPPSSHLSTNLPTHYCRGSTTVSPKTEAVRLRKWMSSLGLAAAYQLLSPNLMSPYVSPSCFLFHFLISIIWCIRLLPPQTCFRKLDVFLGSTSIAYLLGLG